MTSAHPRIQGFCQSGSGWSEMLTHTAPDAAAMPTSKPSTEPASSPVRPTPKATDRPFSIWTRNIASAAARGIFAIVMGV